MTKMQALTNLFKAFISFVIYEAVLFSPLVLIVYCIIVDSPVQTYPTLFKTILAFNLVNLIEIALALHYSGKCMKDPENVEKYVRKYLEKTAAYYFESDEMRQKNIDWHITKWTAIINK